MTETIDELIAEHSRKGLEEIAAELGVDASDTAKYPNKTSVAEAIVEARENVLREAHEASQEIPEVEVQASVQSKLHIGEKGVFAKRAAMDERASTIQKGVSEMQKDISGMQKSIGAQKRVNEGAFANIGAGINELQSGIDRKAGEMQSGASEMQSGVVEMQNAILELEKGIMEFRDEFGNYEKDFYYGSSSEYPYLR
ncbi:MAG TPA: hypothetical protein EYP67_08120, partial [Methanosarcinales archaeon]|nr:hypothetical protein [Methanosarcinales archaeon]